ncbi:MAG: anhydro-N-acetylmuramic acid kinase [Rhizobiaceae bacterium]
MKTFRAIGLMSGTSMDGIDVALIETDGVDFVRRGPGREYAYDPAFRNRLAAALETAKGIVKREERPGNLADLERDITLRHCDAVRRFLTETGNTVESLDVIGFHGQTVLHRPEQALTVQLGDGQLLADETGIQVVYDLRANDMAHGGQGAPLVPAYHQALAASLGDIEAAAFVNIGGISNVTFVGASEPVAFDTGPGNALIDQWVQQMAGIPFDDGGRVASEGAVNEELVAQCLAMPFFAKRPPKSLDRNDFSPDLVAGLDLSDGARTLAAITARSIFASADHAQGPPKTWIICGGGRKNRMIFSHLCELAEKNNQQVIAAEDAGFDGSSMEAEAWAYLAVRSLKGLAITFPTTTGVKTPVTGGVTARPKSV